MVSTASKGIEARAGYPNDLDLWHIGGKEHFIQGKGLPALAVRYEEVCGSATRVDGAIRWLLDDIPASGPRVVGYDIESGKSGGSRLVQIATESCCLLLRLPEKHLAAASLPSGAYACVKRTTNLVHDDTRSLPHTYYRAEASVARSNAVQGWC
jgi:hypothetical protein